ncbi:hypothetical protein M8J77_005040 [Diaphorina citri]|nr:hypothetical protein M8J77_005040 [Diaphorina citri]
MGKGQYRAVISFLILDGKKCDEIKSNGKRFTSKDDVSTPKKRYFEDFDGSCYLEGLKMWQGRWVKCVALKIDQVEK